MFTQHMRKHCKMNRVNKKKYKWRNQTQNSTDQQQFPSFFCPFNILPEKNSMEYMNERVV